MCAKKGNHLHTGLEMEQKDFLCTNLNFAAAEAYKLLRTNLVFSLPDGKSCHVVGVTSSIRGEGKSTTSVNLSYTIAETGKRVLLIDADMRLPSVAKKLEMPNKPGLSNVLVNMCSPESAIHRSEYLDNWHILPAGNIPPNPSELLGSEQMKKLIALLSQHYDYIIVDLPPVTIVSDALVFSNLADGLLFVVRQNYSSRGALKEAMRQINFLDSKLLGFVMTGTNDGSKRYGRYKKYGRNYGEKNYGSADKSGKQANERSYEDVYAWQHMDQTIQNIVEEERSKK